MRAWVDDFLKEQDSLGWPTVVRALRVWMSLNGSFGVFIRVTLFEIDDGSSMIGARVK
jgi:hypothetical protein